MIQKLMKRYHKTPKPFLVLPLIVTDCLDTIDGCSENMAIKNPGLRLFTKTGPKKSKSKKTRDERPLTATLERPTIIDIRFVGKIDMSLVRKEFLNITNLCRIPLIVKQRQIPRPLSLPPPSKKHGKYKKKKTSDMESSCEEDRSICSVKSTRSLSKLSSPRPKKILSDEGKNKKIKCDANNNSFGGGIPRSTANHNHQLRNQRLSVANKAAPVARDKAGVCTRSSTKQASSTSSSVAEPCKSCGRKDQPERLHSHPVVTPPAKTTTKPMEKTPAVSPVKSTVQKPLAMKYISKSNQTTRTATKPTKLPVKSSNPTLKPEQKPPPKSPAAARPASAKRTMTCYLCGREFGTASLPLHEPKCLQKWELENASLPKHLQRKPPPKPSSAVNKEEWDDMAWKSSQATLIPCQNCGRTFYPDRLIVHQRSCKTPTNLQEKDHSQMDKQDRTPNRAESTNRTHGPPPTFECYICGRTFGVNSIGIHERQCLKKWTAENDSLPPDIRSPPPVKKEKSRTPEQKDVNSNDRKSNNECSTSSAASTPPSSGRKPPLFPCYICGKLFTVNSIYIHEPQCLKMWKIENDKLPPNKRRPQPLKPDVKFTPSGSVDFVGTFNRIWENHLAELVECRKCGRKFFPDRIEKHEQACANIRIDVKRNFKK